MTPEQQAFEEWFNPRKLSDNVFPLESSLARAYAFAGWQASRAALKQELLGDEMVEVVAAAIDAEEHKNDGDTYPLAKRIKLYGRDSQYEIFNNAKAALQAVVGELA